MPEYSNYLEGLTAVVGALDGTEIIGASKDGDAVSLTSQQIANLGGGGGGGTVTSVAGTTNRITSTGGATPVIDIDAAYDAIIAAKAPLASPTFTGTPVVPGYQTLVNSAGALIDAASIDLTAIKHTLATALGRTFTISFTGDDITLEITLSATSATQTFPATALCVSEGVASGDNTCPMSGVSGDIYIIAIKKIGSNYRVVCKNFGQ